MCVAALQRKRVSLHVFVLQLDVLSSGRLFLTRASSAFRSDHYAFVTFYDMNDAFAAIDNGSKLRRPDELPFDLCFGGRRQFCNSDYADLGKSVKNSPQLACSIFNACCVEHNFSHLKCDTEG